MIAFISICYAGLYFLIFNKLGLLKKTAGNISAFSGIGVAMIGAIVFMWYTFSPMSGDARMFRYIIPIVPNVKGQVIDVPIKALTIVERGETLFQIDPEPFEFAVRQTKAEIERYQADWRLAKVNVERAEKLLKLQSAAQVDLDTWTANMDAATANIAISNAKLDNAQWQLEKSTVTAPSEGYVVNLQLRPGAMVTTIPLASPMAFVSYEANGILSSFSQSAIRKISVDDAAEVVFTNIPGAVFAGRVERIVEVGSQSQLLASDQLPTLTGTPVTDRWAVMIELTDEDLARQIPQGAGGTVAIYTQKGKPLHIISKVALRMSAWLGYLTSP